MILVSHRSTEQRHDPIPGKLVDGAFIFVDFVHQNLEAAVHDLVDFLRVKLFRNGSIIGYIGKKHRHQFSFARDGAAGGENLIGKKFFLDFWNLFFR
jgi:hypothetical protein